jgi:uncharacterized repeat protein (TIGR01451 family)
MRSVQSAFRAFPQPRWLAAAGLLVLCASPALAQVPAGYSEYYIPGDEDNLSLALCTHGSTSNACTSTSTHAVISVTAWADNTRVYYDHWEDGYNFDPANPTTANEAYTLQTGERMVFESATITLPRTATPPAGSTCTNTRNGDAATTDPDQTYVCYDGRDRIYTAGGPVTVSRVAWNEGRGVGVQGAAWEIYPVKPQLTTYVFPFGENIQSGETAIWYGFQRVAALIQATADNTVITIDVTGDGVADLINANRNTTKSGADGDTNTVTLNRGQTFLLDRVSACRLTTNCTTNPGTLNTGTVIWGTSTLQVKYITGRTNVSYCTRGFSAFPRGFWTSDYYAPLDQPTDTGNGLTDYYLYNPNAASITVDWEGLATSGSFAVPAGSAVSFRTATGGNAPVGSGLYFRERNGNVFWGVGSNDAEDYAHEWGYSLLPSTMLFKEHFLGWAPDAYQPPTNPAAGDADMGAFLSVAQDNTTIFVDYDSNSTVDQTYTLNRLQTQYVVNPTGDLSGAHFWGTGPFTLAYGQNGNTASTTAPALDLGYVAIPGTDFISLVLSVSKSVNPQVVPTASGSTAQFTLTVSSQKYTVDGVNVTDLMPPNWQYVSGSTTIVRPDKTQLSGTPDADPTITGVPATGQTLAWSTTQVGNASAPSMLQNQAITITFTGQTTAAFTAGTLSQNRVTAVGTRTVGGVTQTFTAKNFVYVTYGNVGLSKTSSVATNTPLYPGDPLTYTTTVTNPSGPTVTGVSLYDPMPAGTSYVTASGSVTCERPWNVRDEFATAAYTNNDGSANWAGNWTETDAYGGGATGATGGFAWITGGQLQLRYLLSNVRDEFATAAYTNNGPNNSANWAGPWTETNDDGTAGAGFILVTGGYARFRGGGTAQANRAISRTATVTGATTATIDFDLTDLGIDAGETMVAEYSFDGITYVTIGTLDGGAGWTWGAGGAVPLTIAVAGRNSLIIRFRAPQVWSSTNNDEARVDNVDISFNLPANATGTQIQRTANLTGALAPSLSFTYAAAGLVAGDTVVLEASSTGAAPFTPLATFAGGTPSVAPPYDLTAYISATTTIRFRVTGGYNAAGKTLSFSNVDITYVAVGTFASGNPPEFLSTSTGCRIRAGGTPVTLTFNATVTNPLPSGITSITNTASTTSVQFPIALSASVTNIVANPTSLSASVAGRVWLDADHDGVQDVGEPGLANVEVTLKDRFGTPVATAATDLNGRYLFSGVTPVTGVPPGTGYYVEATDRLPSGVTQTFPSPTSNNRTTSFDLLPGQSYGDADLGYRSADGVAAFGDLVWVDPDADGLRDSGEIGLGGVTVQLYQDANSNGHYDDGVDTLKKTTTTAPDGSYLFTGWTAGSTYFVIATSPFTPGTPEYTPTTAASFVFPNAVAGTAYVTADFGFRGDTISTYTLTDRVWLDANGNGVFGAGEFGIAGVTVSLLDKSLNVIGTTVTAADGTFTFSGLAGGGADYTVRLTDSGGVLTDYVGTTDFARAKQRADSNVNANVDHTVAPSYGSYGFQATRAIGDTVFFDLDGDGVQDPGENGIAGVVVKLYHNVDGDGVIDAGEPQVGGSVTTDANGQYLFAGLSNWDYIVSVSTPTGYVFTGPGSDSDSGTAGIQKAVTMSGTNIDTVDFGFRAPPLNSRTISGVVWDNANADAVIDGSETRLAGVTLEVLLGSTVVATVTTDTNGYYSVVGLVSGTGNYTVQVTDTAALLIGYTSNFERTGGINGPFDNTETVDVTGGDVTNVHFGYTRPAPTYAAVAYLTAFLVDGSVTVEWRTTLEAGTAGFHLLRLDPSTGQYVRVTERLVPGLVVHPRGGVYRFVDAGAPPEGTLGYRLVEEDVRGRSREYGPYSVSVSREAPPRALDDRTADDLRVLSFSRRAVGPARPPQAVRAAVAAERQVAARATVRRQGSALKLTTRETGIHYVSVADVASALGLPVRRVATLLRAGWLRLSERGRVVPYLPDGTGTGAYFYGEPVGSLYTDENAYWVAVAPGSTMAVERAAPTGLLTTTSFTEALHQEQEQFPVLINFRDPEVDFWVWDYLYAGYEGLDARSFAIRAIGVTGAGDASLTVHLLGGTDTVPGDDHHAQVLFNGQPVGEARWDGLASFDIEFPLPPGSVLEGDNAVEVRALLDGGVPESLFYVDSFDLTYERRYRAVDDALTFTAAGGTQVAIGGFTGPGVLLFDVTVPSRPVLVTGSAASREGDGRYEVRFGATGSGETRRYQALLPYRAKAAARVRPWQDAGLSRETNAADYLLVVPESLKEAARSLAQYRVGQGLATMVVGLEDIYDEFNAGLAEPPAIRTFLRYATSRWSTPPRYVALVGRGTYDYKDVSGFGDNLVPTLLVGSPDGLVASDIAFADLTGDDGVPEIAIGRVPVLTAADLADYVAKIQAHESSAGDAWQRHVLMAADDPDVAGNFTADSESVTALLPPDYTATRVDLATTPPAAGRAAILQAINDGVVAFNYIGHGAPDRLAQENLFTTADVASLHNSDRLPVFLAMTCSAGNFATPGYPSLGEAMLLRKGGGAFAVWAPSGLSENPSAVRLDQGFFRGAFVDGEKVLGDLVVRSLGELDASGSTYMRYMYNLLGEPVSRLPD